VRRVLLREEQVPAAEKVLSLFEDHTMIITRRKVAKPREYGRKVLLDELDGGLNKPLGGALRGRQGAPAPTREHRRTPRALRTGARASDRRPRTLLLQSQRRGRQKGGHTTCRPAAEWPPYEETNGVRTAERWFRRAFAFRAGVEGRISVLRRKYGLERCPYHGEDGMGRWVGWGIVVHNLAKISKKQAARQGC
jgi:transposase, IS5 family